MKIIKSVVTGVVLAAGATYGLSGTVVLSATADDRLLQLDPTTNDNSEGLATYNSTFGGNPNGQRTAIQFDYSSLAGQTVTSATLRLYGQSFSNSTAATSVDLYRLASAWNETQVTWNIASTGSPWTNAGGDGLGTTGGQLTSPFTHWTGNGTATSQWFEFDATALVTGALDGTFVNHGILMTGPVGNQLVFVSREGHVLAGNGTAADEPQLVVTTATPEPSTSVAILAGLVAIGIKRRKKNRAA